MGENKVKRSKGGIYLNLKGKKAKKSNGKIATSKLKNQADSFKNNKKRKFVKLNKNEKNKIQNINGTNEKENDKELNKNKFNNKLVEGSQAEDSKTSKSTENVDLNKENLYDPKDSALVFIGNVPLTIKTKSDLVKKLQIDPKIIQSVHFRSLPIHPKYARNKKVAVIKQKFSDAKDNQNAYVKLSDPKYLNELLEKNTLEVDGHHLFINTSDKDSFSKFSRKKTVFVGRLPPTANEDDLYNIFMNISPVKAVRIVRDPVTMKSKGFGFVAFDNRPAVVEAIRELNNTEFKGYTLNVTKCLEEIQLKDKPKFKNKNKFNRGNKGSKNKDNKVSKAIKKVNKSISK
ncbi:RNA-binding protein 34 [Theileria parva strain Muguga]|uniref:RNA-binding protein 34 n=1 Tax=Theileria parva strain Muguga TaxID=333668 RepID=UPI001C624119|nr:RNA-binding protein 34 [Theileria parva strain Muguga]EAN32192.2 RNA-binding protein 34 [Theileria parva strain Muguga]